MGLPVVATPIAELVLDASHGQVMALAGDPAAFVDAIDEALSRRTPKPRPGAWRSPGETPGLPASTA